jgi:acyl-coenzyme A thioesterase PaaI-like protein
MPTRRGGRICCCEVTVRDDAGAVVAKGLVTHNYA